MKILLVDDNLDLVHSMAILLRLEGHHVDIATQGIEAVAMARLLRPEIILLDIGLPRMNGYEVARELRGMPELCGVRLYAVTGYGTAADRERALAAGFDGHFSKPIDHEQLQRLLRQG